MSKKRKRDSSSGQRNIESYFSKQSDNDGEDEDDIGESASNEAQSQPQRKHHNHTLINLALDQLQAENGNWTLFFHFNIHFAGSTSSCRIDRVVYVDDVLVGSTIDPGAPAESDSDSDSDFGNEPTASGKKHSFISSYIY